MKNYHLVGRHLERRPLRDPDERFAVKYVVPFALIVGTIIISLVIRQALYGR